MLESNIIYDEIAMLIKKISIVNDLQEITTLFDKIKQATVVSFVNAHAINLAVRDSDFRKSLLASDYILVDGIGMRLLYRYLGLDYGLNMNGTDYIPYLLKGFSNKSISLYGSTFDVIQKTKEKLQNDYGYTVVDCQDGFQNLPFYLNRLRNGVPALVLLGMGMPKQEGLSILIKEKIEENSLIVNGGAIVDFIGDKVRRAPKFFLKLHLEWFYRLCVEPRRLFYRYVIGNVLFMMKFGRIKSHFESTII
ncbi:WecB/TagA/CpsF family glycosyltransferase [Sphingobacterium sp. MYb382]|uniref:WecB/TagA/CpsF family glycosyltransferase n=1 Tax=Sphingobacterium sp. MYb382 TaxID=2745278 RepID=UPI0030B6B3D3